MVDFGAGNLHSVRRALEHAGARAEVTFEASCLATADGIVLPGVGSARSAMKRLGEGGVDRALARHVETGKPLLGVCLGMQLLFGPNEEGPTNGLGLLDGSVVKMCGRTKVPHMGWNNLRIRSENPLLYGVNNGDFVYFVHSYEVRPETSEDVIAVADYEGEVVSVVGRDNVLGTQFHPEKSGDLGLRIYSNFVEVVSRCT